MTRMEKMELRLRVETWFVECWMSGCARGFVGCSAAGRKDCGRDHDRILSLIRSQPVDGERTPPMRPTREILDPISSGEDPE